MVLNLVEPQSSGIGGGAFLLVHDARRGKLIAYDGRETAPAAARPDRFLDETGKPLHFFDAVVGGRSVGVPGALRMLELAHRRHGRLSWAALFDPAIRLAESGFAVSPRLHAQIAAERFLRQDRARAYFYNADGTPLAVGQLLQEPRVRGDARTHRRRRRDAFYNGEIARDIVEHGERYEANPGDLTAADFAGYARSREGGVRPLSRATRCAACRRRRPAASPCCRSSACSSASTCGRSARAP